MGILNFWNKKKPEQEQSQAHALPLQQRVIKPFVENKVVDPIAELEEITGNYYRAGNYSKAYESATKVIALGGRINDTMLSIIKSKVGTHDSDDLQTFTLKIKIILDAINTGSFLDFEYCSETTNYYDSIFKITPLSIKEQILQISNTGKIYDINKMKNIRSYTDKYYSDKPN